MLAVLRIQNLVLVEEAEIEFGTGLNVLTGETGAGKSIILKSMELLTGKRASPELIRSGAERCVIEGLFHLAPRSIEALSTFVDDLTEIVSSDELLIRRVIELNGRSKVYVNGSLATTQVLQNISASLLDITGQHQQQALLEDENHLRLLDEFGVAEELLKTNEAAYEIFAKAEKELASFKKDARERLLYYERIKAEFDELDELALREGERDELESDQLRLANVEMLSATVSSCLEAIEDSDDNLARRLRQLCSQIEQARRLDPSLQETLQLLEGAALQIDEAKLSLGHYGASLEADPIHLENLRQRIADIARVERKYHLGIPDLLLYFRKISDEIAEFEAGGLDEKKLTAKRDSARSALDRTEAALSSARKKAAKDFSTLVERGLGELSMKKARFSVEVGDRESGRLGKDSVIFTLAANPGEPFRALSKVASGGELSRILLVLKTIISEKSAPGTQVFDEIDAGIGGAVAQTVGEKLKRVAEDSQVIVVSHSPQIAALADTHFLIAKSSSDTRTETQVSILNPEERIQHIAAMMAGKEITSHFEDSARQLITQATQIAEKSRGKQKAALV